MADVSKIKTLDGTTYNIKDATARSSIPAAASAKPLMDGAVAVGSSTKYAREDHRHPVDTSRAAASHTHTSIDIIQGDGAVSGNLDPLTQAMIGSGVSNKSFALPAAAIQIEYSTNAGSTWIDYGASDNEKRALFAETRSFSAYLGKNTAKASNTVNNWLRITIEATDRYVSFNGLYIWMSTSGNTVTVDLERSTIGAKNTFTTVFTGQSISGWSGNNIRYFSYGTFGGASVTSVKPNNHYKYRLTFKQTAVNTNYASASINDIRFLGANVWVSPNNMVSKNHLYTWDVDLNATFPARVNATSFNGHTINSDVPANAKFTDTTYESKAAASGGTALSLVTTGEKYAWNNKGSGTITGIKMNGASKGTSGVVDLGTVITTHQDISGKLNSSLKGAANGLAELDANGKVPSSQLPCTKDQLKLKAIINTITDTFVDALDNHTKGYEGLAFKTVSGSVAAFDTRNID